MAIGAPQRSAESPLESFRKVRERDVLSTKSVGGRARRGKGVCRWRAWNKRLEIGEQGSDQSGG